MLEELRRHKSIVQERIMKSFGYADTEDFIQKGEDEVELIQKGEIDYDWELQKAVYADTPQNRKLGRVGQEYHRGRKKKNADAAKKELQNRGKSGGDGGSKPESSKKKRERIQNEISEFFKKTDTHNESPEYHKKLKDIMEREHLTMNKMMDIAGNFMGASQAIKARKAIEGMKAEEGSGGVNKVHEKVKKDTIKDITSNGAGGSDDRFIDNNKTDYYKSIMKKYGVSSVGDLADKLGQEKGGYEKYEKIYTKMLRQIPASAFHKEYGD